MVHEIKTPSITSDRLVPEVLVTKILDVTMVTRPIRNDIEANILTNRLTENIKNFKLIF